MMGLTPRQEKAWRYIALRMAMGGIAPTLDEIARHIGVKTRSGAHAVLERLVARGKIRRLKQQARAIEVLEWPPHGPSCPHCGATFSLQGSGRGAKNETAPADAPTSHRGLTEAT